jgi:hypothetical protein
MTRQSVVSPYSQAQCLSPQPLSTATPSRALTRLLPTYLLQINDKASVLHALHLKEAVELATAFVSAGGRRVAALLGNHCLLPKLLRLIARPTYLPEDQAELDLADEVARDVVLPVAEEVR